MKKFLVFLLAYTTASFLYAQSADKITEILESEQLTYGQASYIAASALGLADDETSYEEALQTLQRHDYIKASRQAQDYITLKELALICTRTWNIQDSVMYALFHTPRYALRQMKAAGIIADSEEPGKIPSGSEFLNIVTLCLDRYPRTGESE